MFSGSLSVISAVFRSFPCAKQGHTVHSQQSIHQLHGCKQPIRGQTLGISHDSDRLGPRDLCWSKFENFQQIFLGPMWKVRNFDLKALGISSKLLKK